MAASGFVFSFSFIASKRRERRGKNTDKKVFQGELGRPDVILIITPSHDWKAPWEK